MAEEQRSETGVSPEGAPATNQTASTGAAQKPAYDPLQPGFGFRMTVEPPKQPEATAPQETAADPQTAETDATAQEVPAAAPVPVEQVTVTVAPAEEEEPAKKGKKPHRKGAKYKKNPDEPLPEERAPKRMLSTKRGLVRFLFFTVITCGIYTLFFLADLAEDMNILACRHDGRRTPNLLLLPFITVLTLGVGYFVYWHRFASRIREELWRRGIDYEFGPKKFWGWGLLGILLIGIGPLVFFHKLCVALNELSADYNLHG